MAGGAPAATEPAPAETPAPALSSLPLAHRAAFWGFAALLLAGIAFYVWWGLPTFVWVPNGVYAVVATLAGFGLAGMWLVSPEPSRPIPHRP